MSFELQTAPTPPLIDQAAMAEWCTDLDREDIADILGRVPAQCTASIAEIETAVGEKELAKVKRVAHRLKGMAANLGAARLARLARCIELESKDLADVELQLPVLKTTVAETLAALAEHA